MAHSTDEPVAARCSGAQTCWTLPGELCRQLTDTVLWWLALLLSLCLPVLTGADLLDTVWQAVLGWSGLHHD